MAIKRLRCPFHNDDTPSLVVYHSGYKCFGCGKYGPLSEINIESETASKPVNMEDIRFKMQYINSLPVKEIRGLELPYDDKGYYVVWPYKNYYKIRLWEGSSKYLSPSGVSKPPFMLKGGPNLLLCEGEINALSLFKACSGSFSVLCPGSASDFAPMRLKSLLSILRTYRTIIIVTDRDAAGVIAAIKAKEYLKQTHYVIIDCFEKDANEILVNDGKEKLFERIKNYLELS